MCLGSPLGVGTNFRKPGFSQAGQSKAPCCGKSVRMLEHHLHVAGGRFQFRLKPRGFCSDTCLKGSLGGLLLARSGSVHQSNSRARELLVSPPTLPCCDPNDHCRLSRARPMLGLVYHLKAAQLSSKCCYLFASGYIFNGCLVPAAVLLIRSPVLSNRLLVPVAGDSHWDYWISRQCGLLDSVPVATVRTGRKMGQAWLVLPSQCWG